MVFAFIKSALFKAPNWAWIIPPSVVWGGGGGGCGTSAGALPDPTAAADALLLEFEVLFEVATVAAAAAAAAATAAAALAAELAIKSLCGIVIIVAPGTVISWWSA